MVVVKTILLVLMLLVTIIFYIGAIISDHTEERLGFLAMAVINSLIMTIIWVVW